MTARTLETDYLVIGAGAMGMAFVDEVMTQDSSARVILVDEHAKPGGHWNDSYSFVSLHQPAAFYGVNSENLGPYGDAIVQELIPEVERRFRGIGKPHGRFLTGGSTGGWIAVAMQVWYPDFFGGCWSFFPDQVDFRN